MFQLLIRLFLVLTVAGAVSAGTTAPVSSPQLAYATYVGAGPSSVLQGFAVDSSGYVYVAGTGPGVGSSTCQFLTKLNQTGTETVWSTCLPVEEIGAVTVDRAGNIYVVGSNSPLNPKTSTVMKLSPDAHQTIYSTQIAGGYAGSIALDGNGNAYVSGSADSTFQTAPGAYMSTGGKAFALKLNTAGSIQYATYLDLFGGDIAVDSNGQVWVVGTTCPASSGSVGSNCDTTVYGTAAAVRKLDANGAHLLAAQSFGGGSNGRFQPIYYDSAAGVAVDGSDSAWVVGVSQTGEVPTTPNALELTPPGPLGIQGVAIGYALKLSSSGNLVYGSYIGNNQDGQYVAIDSVAVDAQGRPYFGVDLNYSESDLNPLASVMVLSADGSSVLATAAFNSFVQNVALDGNGGLYLAGTTSRIAFFTIPGAYQTLWPGGSQSGYAAKFDLTTPALAAQFSTMVNSASFVPGDNPMAPEGAVAPGEIVTLFGVNLPSNPKLNFDGHPATILYSDAKQINAVVPFEVSAPSTVVNLEGVRGYVLPVWPAVPALFTANASGSGQLAALNQDSSVSSDSNPAKAGSIVSVFMTGAGAMTPPIGDGQLGPLQPPFPAPVLGVSATVNGVEAPVLFAGQAPGLIAGAVQVNIQIPAGTASGDAKLIVYIGNYQTQIVGTTVAVQ